MFDMLNPFNQKNKNDEHQTIPVPKNVTVTQEGSDLIIKRKWSVYGGIKNLGWSAFVFVMTFSVFGSPLQQTLVNDFFSKETLALLLIFGFLFVIGIFLLVLGIYQIFDSTTIRVNTVSISTQHQLLPWRTRTFSAPDIEKVFITSHVGGDILGTLSSSRRRTDGKPIRRHYSVNLLMSGDQKAMLIQQLPNIQALFIQQEIERHLNIQNRTVNREE